MKIKIEDIVFWILILVVAVILIWMVFGSPSLEEVAIPIGLFIISSEILLWRALFQIDKKTAIGFNKVNSDFKIMRNDLENKYKKIEIELTEIKSLVKRK